MRYGEDALGPGTYARWRASELGAVTERVERRLLFELAGDVAGRDVLDVGCGDGDLALALWARGARVSGIDVSAAMIEAARARARAQGADIALCRAEAEKLPFASGSFDLVSAVTVLCFVADAEAAVREAARVLRPGGRLILADLGRWSPWAARRRVRAWLGAALWRTAHFRTAGELRRLVRRAGLVPVRTGGAVYYPPCRAAARILAPYDPRLGRITTVGAAFVAVAAVKADAGTAK